MFTDDLAAKQITVKKVFLKLKAEKQKVNHLLYRIHSNHTLQKYAALLKNCSLTVLHPDLRCLEY